MNSRRPTIRYASVCSGVEAASLAWGKLGWNPVWFSEVEPFPCAVLKEHFPDVPNLGDMTKINGTEYHGKIDLLAGGTPCQDLSVAGKRAGFNGARSSLALDFVRLAYESGCKWFVWENVPGVFSSNGGGDFATLLSLFTGIKIDIPKKGFANSGFICNGRRDRYGVAWRVLDAQFTRTSGFPFAVPQRRRRVFVVGYFGDWTRAAQVLLEYDRLQWDSPARIKARETIAGNIGIGPDQTSRNFQAAAGIAKKTDVACTIDVKCKDGAIRNQAGMAVIKSGTGFYSKSESAQTLEAHEDQQRRNIVLSCGNGQVDGARSPLNDVCGTLNCMHDAPIIVFHGSQDPSSNADHANAVNRNQGLENCICIQQNQVGEIRLGEVSGSMTTNSNASGRNFPIVAISQHVDVAGTLTARYDSSPCADCGMNIIGRKAQNGGAGIGTQLTVRRLTPLECERLMGFPDNYTRISRGNKTPENCPDAPRYKACGNSMCVNVMQWIGERIDTVEKSLISN